MSGVVKKANLGVKQHETSSCTLSHFAESRQKNKKRFPMAEEIPSINKLVKDCRDSNDCGILEDERREVSSRLDDEMPQKYGGSNDTQEGERMEEGLIRSRQQQLFEPTPPPISEKLENPPPPPKYRETFQRRSSLLPLPLRPPSRTNC